MKTRIYLLTLAALLTLGFIGCKKNHDAVITVDSSSEMATHSDDDSRFSTEIDAVANDANAVVDNYTAINGRIDGVQGIPCDATVVVDSISNPRTVTVTYNGTNCNGTRTRTGVVKISIPSTTRWINVGAVLTVTVTNLKITRIIDNKSITINGVTTFTNVSGGLLRNLATLGTVTHKIASTGMTVTFDDGSVRTWQVAKQRVFTYSNSNIVITTTGTYTDNGTTGIAEWGTNRFGNAFVTAITQPLIVRGDCNFRLTAGQVTHSRLIGTGVVTFGLDASGNPTSCPAGFYYFKLVFTGPAGVVRTVIMPY